MIHTYWWYLGTAKLTNFDITVDDSGLLVEFTDFTYYMYYLRVELSKYLAKFWLFLRWLSGNF